MLSVISGAWHSSKSSLHSIPLIHLLVIHLRLSTSPSTSSVCLMNKIVLPRRSITKITDRLSISIWKLIFVIYGIIMQYVKRTQPECNKLQWVMIRVVQGSKWNFETGYWRLKILFKPPKPLSKFPACTTLVMIRLFQNELWCTI